MWIRHLFSCVPVRSTRNPLPIRCRQYCSLKCLHPTNYTVFLNMQQSVRTLWSHSQSRNSPHFVTQTCIAVFTRTISDPYLKPDNSHSLCMYTWKIHWNVILSYMPVYVFQATCPSTFSYRNFVFLVHSVCQVPSTFLIWTLVALGLEC